MEQEGGPHQTDRGKEVRDVDGHFSLSQPPHCPRIPPGDGEGLGLLAAPHVLREFVKQQTTYLVLDPADWLLRLGGAGQSWSQVPSQLCSRL